MPLAPPLSLAADAADGVRVFKVSRSMRRPKRSQQQQQPRRTRRCSVPVEEVAVEVVGQANLLSQSPSPSLSPHSVAAEMKSFGSIWRITIEI